MSYNAAALLAVLANDWGLPPFVRHGWSVCTDGAWSTRLFPNVTSEGTGTE